MGCPSSNHIIALCRGVTFFKPYFIFHYSLGVLNFPRKAAKKKPKEEQVDKDLLQFSHGVGVFFVMLLVLLLLSFFYIHFSMS